MLDHCRGIDLLIEKGSDGEVYNIGGSNEVKNVDLTRQVLNLLERPETLITHVADRPGHDRRYSLDTSKLRKLGWSPQVDFRAGLQETVAWYKENEWWWQPIKHDSAGFQAYYDKQYAKNP